MGTTPLGLVYPDDTDPVTGPGDNGATQMQQLAEGVDALLGCIPIYHGTFSSTAPHVDTVFDTTSGLWRVVISDLVGASSDYMRIRGRTAGTDDTGNAAIVYLGSFINGATNAAPFVGYVGTAKSLAVIDFTRPADAVASNLNITCGGPQIQINTATTPATAYDGFSIYTDGGVLLTGTVDVHKLVQ